MADETTATGGYVSEEALAAPVAPEGSTRPSLGKRQRLVDLIQLNGAIREDRRCEEIEELQRAREVKGIEASAAPKSTGSRHVGFCADLVFHEEETGFELWLGGLDDALSLEGLCERNITGILNCAVEECRKECVPFRPREAESSQVPRGRRRTHARGASLADDGGAAVTRRNLPNEVLRGLAEFNGCWYSEMMDVDMSYYELAAADEDGYRMDDHFEEAAFFLEECRQEGRKVLVHCIMGINRSSVALVSFLCSGIGMDLAEAVALAAKQRGYILSNNSFLDQLVEHFGANLEDAPEVTTANDKTSAM